MIYLSLLFQKKEEKKVFLFYVDRQDQMLHQDQEQNCNDKLIATPECDSCPSVILYVALNLCTVGMSFFSHGTRMLSENLWYMLK